MSTAQSPLDTQTASSASSTRPEVPSSSVSPRSVSDLIKNQIYAQITSSLNGKKSSSSSSSLSPSSARSVRSTRLVWQNVTFTSTTSRFKLSSFGFRRQQNQIISGLTGDLNCGELKAIIGPSGVGKSTLLKIITGRKTSGVNGNIFVENAFVRPMSNNAMFSASADQEETVLKQRGSSLNDSNRCLAKTSYIPQHDYHLSGLTVRESLTFAAKLKLCNQAIPLNVFKSDNFKNQSSIEMQNKSTDNLQCLVQSVLHVLLLEECADTLVPRCSGGQVRRLSIGVELLGFPQLILLDEPTTGLDFVSALQTVRLLRSLTEFPYRPGVLCTIHQPSAEILELFTHLYIIGSGGVCIYDGPVGQVEQFIEKFNLKCPPYFNLADYLLQCSYGEFGFDLVGKMAMQQAVNHSNSSRFKSLTLSSVNKLSNLPILKYHSQLIDGPKPFLSHLWILITRTFCNQLRTSQIIALKFFSSLFIAIFLGSLHNYHIGEADYCFNGPMFMEIDLKSKTFQEFAIDSQSAAENVACSTFLLMYIAFIESIPTCLIFSREVNVIIKERSNGWYSCFVYYLAKTVVEIPFQIISPLTSLSVYYALSGQSSEYWRFGLILSAFILCAIVVRIIGMLIGSILIGDEFSAVLTIAALIAVFVLTGGLFIRDSQVNWPAEAFYFTSVIKFAFHIMLNSIYGLGRCEETLPIDFPLEFNKEQLREYSGNLILMWFEVKDKDFWLGYIGLTTMFAITIVLTYFILNFQINRLSRK